MKTEKVWDPSVRLFHWSLAALVGAAFLTAEDETMAWHVRGGIAIVGLLVYRVIWGFLGPEPARFRAFVHGPRVVLGYLRGYLRGKPVVHRSHNPLGAWMVVTLLAVLAATAISGGLTYASAEWDGPLAAFIGGDLGHALEEVHEGLASSLYVLIPAHVLGVIVSSVLERQNLVKGMITGRKRITDQAAPPAPARLSRFLLAAGAGALVAAGLLALLKPSEAKADVPAATSLLQSWERAARSADPAFAGFSPDSGRRLYLEEFSSKGERVSCASCHGSDPKQKGHTPAGTNLKPLSPAANAKAFSRLDEQAELQLETVELQSLGADLERLLLPAAHAAGLSLQVEIGAEAEIRADRAALRELLEILLENAVRYTPPGGAVGLRGDGRVLTVWDTGRGMSEEDKARAFERFFRGSAAETTGAAGSGLGLVIARSIAHRHAATLELRDREGGGLEATVRWPPTQPRA